jgi:hypothetical protein
MNALQRALRRVCALALVPVAAACAAGYGADVVPPGGAIFAQIKAPLTSNASGCPTGAGVAKTSSSQTKFLQILKIPLNFAGVSFSWDDAAIEKIAREAGMSSVSYADYEFLNVLGIWETLTVTVYGN